MSLSNVGNLMCLYRSEINPGKGTDAAEFCIKAAAKQLMESGGRNWVPVIVKEIAVDQYEVIGNSFVYAIAEEADLERVWCIVTDASEQTFEVTRILTGELIPKINLSTATRDEIQAALQYLIEKPNSELRSVQLAIATNRIDEAARKSWKNFEPIIKLKCGITKGKKLDALKEVFYLTPQSEPEVTTSEVPKPKNLNSLTVTKLKFMAKEKGFSGYTKMKKPELITLLTAG
ncbi:MAG: Rho termination factor [Nodularia sp. (in: Bacteria)]|nr:MAG: Rho termination factor [Nodularia sp. (in: cyanobacteria)]